MNDFVYTQEDLASIMEQLDFTPAEIDANRQYHGKLFQSEDVLECFYCGFMVGETVCAVTGELIQSKVTRDLDALHDQVIDLFDRADAKFKDRHSDPVHRAAMDSLLNCVSVRLQMIKIDMTKRAGDPF
jgi:hypothetical protein